MINVNKLKGIIVEREKTQAEIAELIGMSRSTFYRKMEDGSTFSIQDVNNMIKLIPLSDKEAIDIFFNYKVAETQREETV